MAECDRCGAIFTTCGSLVRHTERFHTAPDRPRALDMTPVSCRIGELGHLAFGEEIDAFIARADAECEDWKSESFVIERFTQLLRATRHGVTFVARSSRAKETIAIVNVRRAGRLTRVYRPLDVVCREYVRLVATALEHTPGPFGFVVYTNQLAARQEFNDIIRNLKKILRTC
jgi:hypothetical protein